MTKEQLPIPTGDDYTQRGEQIVAWYASPYPSKEDLMRVVTPFIPEGGDPTLEKMESALEVVEEITGRLQSLGEASVD